MTASLKETGFDGDRFLQSFIVSLLLIAVSGASAQNPTSTPTARCTVETAYPVRFDFMETPLRNITPIPVPTAAQTATLQPTATPGSGGSGAGFGPDLVVQAIAGSQLDIEQGASFEGVGNEFAGYIVRHPRPDANGDVGAYQYVQWVMNAFAVFDKADGSLIYGPAPGETLFRGFGGPCETGNAGDPMVLYDQIAHRWVLTDLGRTAGLGANQCVAISETEDATGRYYRYEYEIPQVVFPDYPKFALWPNAYYYTADPLENRGLACAFDRDDMLDATPTQLTTPQLQCCLLPRDPGHFRLLPSDLDGEALPQAGTPNFLVNLNKDTKEIQVWRFHVDFGNPLNSMLLGPYPIAGVAPFEGFGCNSTTLLSPCVPQTSTVQKLWTLGTHVMHRLAYRQFDEHASLVVNHTVHLDEESPSERVGVRWYEIRDPSGTPTIFQQGTFAPDSEYRSMGSVATDRLGDIALGHSVSSASSHPSIAITGRAWSDPTPGVMRNELVVVPGSGSQWNPDDPSDIQHPDWGDYTSMSVDPVFDCDFWYTNQYLPEDGFANWKTHVFSFRFPDCTECVGDCNRDEVAHVDELITAINILLLNREISDCFRADGDGSGKITVNELVRTVHHMLNGCPQPPSSLTGGPETASASEGETLGFGEPVDLTVSDAEGFKDDPVSFSITLANASDTVAAFNLDLVYRDDVISTPTCHKDPNQVPLFHGLSSSNPEPGRRRLLLIDTTEYPVPSISDGVVVTCEATILSSAPFGVHDLLLEETSISDGVGNEIPVTIANGHITVLGGPSPTPTSTQTPTPTPIIQSFSPVKDLEINNLVPAGENCPHSAGEAPGLYVGATFGKSMIAGRFLLHFDLSNIPPGATVESATFMHEVLVHHPPGQPLPMRLAEVTQPAWLDTTANWAKYFCNPDGSGSLFWNTTGADFTLEDSAAWNTVDAGHKEIDITTLTQRIVNDDGQLNLILFMEGDTEVSGGLLDELFITTATSESQTYENPSLEVTWRP